MKVMLVTPEFDAERGGVGRYLSDLYASLPAERARVYFDVAVLRPHWLVALPRIWGKLWGFDTEAILHVSHVLPLGTVAWILRLLTGRKYVVSLHGMDFFFGLESPRKRWLMRRVLLGASGVTVNAEALGERVREFLCGSAHVDGHTCRHELLVLKPSLPDAYRKAHEARSASTSGLRILAVGRLVERKGFDTLIRAMHLLSDTRLTIAGDGPDRLRLEKLAEESGMWDRITFEGQVSEAAKRALYAASDVFVLPTREIGADKEGFGIVYLEAQSFGIPVVGGEGIGVREAIHPKLREFAVRHSPESLAAAILRVMKLDTAAYVAPRASELREFVLGFDARTQSHRFWKWLKRL